MPSSQDSLLTCTPDRGNGWRVAISAVHLSDLAFFHRPGSQWNFHQHLVASPHLSVGCQSDQKFLTNSGLMTDCGEQLHWQWYDCIQYCYWKRSSSKQLLVLVAAQPTSLTQHQISNQLLTHFAKYISETFTVIFLIYWNNAIQQTITLPCITKILCQV